MERRVCGKVATKASFPWKGVRRKPANGTTSIANVILQGHNNTAGRDYDIHWDNLQAVPEPASMAAIGLGILGLARRRKANKA